MDHMHWKKGNKTGLYQEKSIARGSPTPSSKGPGAPDENDKSEVNVRDTGVSVKMETHCP